MITGLITHALAKKQPLGPGPMATCSDLARGWPCARNVSAAASFRNMDMEIEHLASQTTTEKQLFFFLTLFMLGPWS